MGESISVLIAVAGTLLGALLTHWFQRRAVRDADKTARACDLRTERTAAYSAYAAAVIAANAQLNRWHIARDSSENAKAARTRSYEFRSAARQALYRVELVAGDETLINLARAAFDAAKVINHAGDESESQELTRQCRATVERFVRHAAVDVR